MTDEELLRALKIANAAAKKIQGTQSISTIEPPTVAPPDPPFVETAQFEEKLNQIQAALLDIDSKLEVEKQARIRAEADNEKQKVMETKRFIISTVLVIITLAFTAVAAVAAVIPLLW